MGSYSSATFSSTCIGRVTQRGWNSWQMLHMYFSCMSQNTEPKRTRSCKHLLLGLMLLTTLSCFIWWRVTTCPDYSFSLAAFNEDLNGLTGGILLYLVSMNTFLSLFTSCLPVWCRCFPGGNGTSRVLFPQCCHRMASHQQPLSSPHGRGPRLHTRTFSGMSCFRWEPLCCEELGVP